MEWWEIALTVASAIVTAGAVTAVIAKWIAPIRKRAKRHSESETALMLFIRDRLKFICRSWIDKEYIPTTDLEDIEEMHTSYKRLGGNGYLDSLMEQIRKLPPQKH